MKEPDFRQFYRNEGSTSSGAGTDATAPQAPPGSTTPEEQIDAAHLSLTSALREELLNRIHSNSPAFLEQLIVDLMVAMGYGGSHKNAAAQLGRTGDRGVDGIINEDRLGLERI